MVWALGLAVSVILYPPCATRDTGQPMTSETRPQAEYQRGLFFLIDTLGFKRLVERAGDNPAYVTELWSLLFTSQEWIKRISSPRSHSVSLALSETVGIAAQVGSQQSPEIERIEIDPRAYTWHVFSDTITGSCPLYSTEYIFDTIVWAILYQYRMGRYRQALVRGALAFGHFYDHDNIVFGPAVVKAAELEKHKAIWPRIVVDPSVKDRLTSAKSRRDFDQMVVQDDKGTMYLDYLGFLFDMSTLIKLCQRNGTIQDDPLNIGNPFEIFEVHRALIEKLASDSRAETKRKNRDKLARSCHALAEYHNSSVDRQVASAPEMLGHFDRLVHLITAARDRGMTSSQIKEAVGEHLKKEVQEALRVKDESVIWKNSLLTAALLAIDKDQHEREARRHDDIGELLLLNKTLAKRLREARRTILNLKVEV